MKCPACSSKVVQRSHSRTPKEKLYCFLLSRHYFRCRACGWRGSVSSLTLQSVLGFSPKKKAMILIVLAAILALVLIEAYVLLKAGEYQPVEPSASGTAPFAPCAPRASA